MSSVNMAFNPWLSDMISMWFQRRKSSKSSSSNSWEMILTCSRLPLGKQSVAKSEKKC